MKETGKDLYEEYPYLKKEIQRLLQCIIQYQGETTEWANIEEAIADLIERIKK